MTKRRIFGIIFGILTVVCLAVIWGNSMTTGTESGQMSGSVTEWVNNVLQKIFPTVEISHMFVRKAAHFTEFAILGILAFANMLIWLPQKRRAFLLLSIPCCFLVALADEFIQGFIAGRVSSFADVLIDTLGATVAVLIFFGAVTLRDSLKNRSKSELREKVNT